jgi:hypothetical protein
LNADEDFLADRGHAELRDIQPGDVLASALGYLLIIRRPEVADELVPGQRCLCFSKIESHLV